MALDVRKQKTQSYLKEHEMVRAAGLEPA